MSTLRVQLLQLLACKDRSSVKCMQAAEELSPEKLQEYKDIFSFFDRKGGGSIGAEEFDQVCHRTSDLIVNIKCTFRS